MELFANITSVILIVIVLLDIIKFSNDVKVANSTKDLIKFKHLHQHHPLTSSSYMAVGMTLIKISIVITLMYMHSSFCTIGLGIVYMGSLIYMRQLKSDLFITILLLQKSTHVRKE